VIVENFAIAPTAQAAIIAAAEDATASRSGSFTNRRIIGTMRAPPPIPRSPAANPPTSPIVIPVLVFDAFTGGLGWSGCLRNRLSDSNNAT
jgi:hypothetical protein